MDKHNHMVLLEFDMDIIRKTRNDSGHPTNFAITEEEFKMHLNAYSSLLLRSLKAIDGLKK